MRIAPLLATSLAAALACAAGSSRAQDAPRERPQEPLRRHRSPAPPGCPEGSACRGGRGESPASATADDGPPRDGPPRDEQSAGAAADGPQQPGEADTTPSLAHGDLPRAAAHPRSLDAATWGRIEDATRACDATRVLVELRGASELDRIRAFDDFVRACPSDPSTPALYEESLLLRDLLLHELDALGAPPAQQSGAATELPFERPGAGLRCPALPAVGREPAPTCASSYEDHAGGDDAGDSWKDEHEGGFFLRVSTGGAYFAGNFNGTATACPGCSEQVGFAGPLRGGALTVEAILGGMVGDVALGLRGSAVVPLSWSLDAHTTPSAADRTAFDPVGERAFALGTIGLAVDWFVTRGSGLHLMLAPSAVFGRVVDADGRVASELLRGFALSHAMGFATAVGDDWHLGVQATIDLGYAVSETSSALGFVAPGGSLELSYR